MKKTLLLLIVLLHYSGATYAQDNSYTAELSPVIGLNLPHNIEGANRSFYTLGARLDVPLSPDISILAGTLYHKRGQDNAYTLDGGLRFSVPGPAVDLFFDGGLHLSRFNAKSDPGETGSTNGNFFGAFFGGGLFFAFGPLPVRLTMRSYVSPSYWLLLDAGVGFRF